MSKLLANQETERLKEELENVNDPEYLERMAKREAGTCRSE